MTYIEYKQSDLHKCLVITGQLFSSIGKFMFSTIATLASGFWWVAKKLYRYIMK